MTAVGVELTCPHCGEGFEAPNGSFMWEPHEVRNAQFIRCGCGETVQMPRNKFAMLA